MTFSELPYEIATAVADHLSVGDVESLAAAEDVRAPGWGSSIVESRTDVPRYMSSFTGDGRGLLEIMLISRMCLVGERSLAFFFPDLVQTDSPWRFSCMGNVAYLVIFLEWLLQNNAVLLEDDPGLSPRWRGYAIRGQTRLGQKFIVEAPDPLRDPKLHVGWPATEDCTSGLYRILGATTIGQQTYISGYIAVCMNFDAINKDRKLHSHPSVWKAPSDYGLGAVTRDMFDLYVIQRSGGAPAFRHATLLTPGHKVYTLCGTGLFGGRCDQLLSSLAAFDTGAWWADTHSLGLFRMVPGDRYGLPMKYVRETWADYPLNSSQYMRESALACARSRFVHLTHPECQEDGETVELSVPKGRSFVRTGLLRSLRNSEEEDDGVSLVMECYVPPGETPVEMYVEERVMMHPDTRIYDYYVLDDNFARLCEEAIVMLLRRFVGELPRDAPRP